jgi:hypothetical protein
VIPPRSGGGITDRRLENAESAQRYSIMEEWHDSFNRFRAVFLLRLPVYRRGTGRGCEPPAEFGSVTPETFIPRFATTRSFKIVVTGGPGKQSQTWSPFPQVVKPVSVKIDM